MNREWNRVVEVFDSAIDREPAERASFVHDMCAGDENLRRQVEALLAEADRPEQPVIIDQSIGEIVADLLADNGPVVVGTQLGAYRIESLLGVGGMGEVYRAKDTLLGRHVAIKVLPPAFTGDPERLARFKREAQILASLNHPNIGAIYGLDESGRRGQPDAGLVLEAGWKDPRWRKKLDARTSCPWTKRWRSPDKSPHALEAAHGRGVVHRDPETGQHQGPQDGAVKVLDFGLAKSLEEAASVGQRLLQRTRRPLQALQRRPLESSWAPPLTCRPSRREGRLADTASDIWSFGCVIHEMLTGTRALSLATTRRTDWRRYSPGSLTGHGFLPRLSPALGTFIRRCLHKNQKERIADVQDVRLALEGAFEGADPSPVAPESQPSAAGAS